MSSTPAPLRLDKLLSAAGWGSRAEMRAAIKSGRVTVDGAAASDPAFKVDPAWQSVTIDGQDADYRGHDYIMLHKPAGVVSATEDPTEPTVLSLLPPRYQRRGLFPAGRLDKDTTGLLLLTNDGALCHRLTAPGRTARVYEATVDSPINPGDVRAFAVGLRLPDGETCLPAELLPDEKDSKKAQIILREGKFHQIKRMFLTRNHTVLTLKRLSHSSLRLDDNLPPGSWRPLTDTERQTLLSTFL